MSGIFGIVSKSNCASTLFYGTDYHSHMGTEYGGMAVLGTRFNRAIHDIGQSQFKSKFVDEYKTMQGPMGIGVISVYTRAQAIEDGVLIDVSPVAMAEHGFRSPVAVTDRVWSEVVIPPGEVATWQDDLGRLNDLLTCLKYGIKRSQKASEVIFKMDVINEGEKRKTITLKRTCTPGDNLEPVITVMFPDED